MIKWTLILGALLIIGYLMSCQAQKGHIDPEKLPEKSTFERAQEVLGKGSKVISNSDETLYLCLRYEVPRTIYCVVDQKMNFVLKRKSTRGEVKWHSTTSLEVENLPGVIQDESSKKKDYTSIVELKKQQN